MKRAEDGQGCAICQKLVPQRDWERLDVICEVTDRFLPIDSYFHADLARCPACDQVWLCVFVEDVTTSASELGERHWFDAPIDEMTYGALLDKGSDRVDLSELRQAEHWLSRSAIPRDEEHQDPSVAARTSRKAKATPKYGHVATEAAADYVTLRRARKRHRCEGIATDAMPEDVRGAPMASEAYFRSSECGRSVIQHGDVYVRQWGFIEGEHYVMECCLPCALHHGAVIAWTANDAASSAPLPPPSSLAELSAARDDGASDRGINWTRLRAFADWVAGHPESVGDAINERPPRSGEPLLDNLLAAMAEQMADDAGIERPDWCEAVRPLRKAYLPPGTPGMQARQRDAAPEVFVRRRIFVSAETIWRPQP